MGCCQWPMMHDWREMIPQGMREMMHERWGMMPTHVQAVETHLANIEALLRDLVQLQKEQKTP